MSSKFYKLAVFFACVFPALSSLFAWDISKVRQKKPVGEPYDRPSQKIIRNWPRPDTSKIGTEPKIVSDGSLSKNLGFDKIVFITSGAPIYLLTTTQIFTTV